jgi:predicted porin
VVNSQAQIYAVNAVYHCVERLDLALALQQVRSFAEFDPQINDVSATQNTRGIKEISRIKTVESTLSARADYRFARNLSSALEYAFKDYDEKNTPLFNGSVNSVMLYLAARW